MDRLDAAADLAGAEKRLLVSQTRRVTEASRRVSCNLRWLLEHLEEATF